MISLTSSRNYIIIKDKKELELAKACDVCRYIILENNNVIYIWSRAFGKWTKEKYVLFGNVKEKDEETTGIKAYQSFYSYCGKDEIEKMKHILTPIPIWESYEQMHYANISFMGKKIYENIYEFDANSAFTYGALQLPDGFELLKEYMTELYEKKETAQNKITRSRYKNLQNYLIGYFARIKDFVRVRSEIIRASNFNIQSKMAEIVTNKGYVYLSNTDSIVTNEVGAAVMEKYTGNKVGQFKLSTFTDRLYYKSPNAYQLGEKVVYSGVSYFARKHTDFFKEQFAEQKGSLIEPFDFALEATNESYYKLCRVRYGEIVVTVVNKIGEKLDTIIYKIGGQNGKNI